MGSFHRTVWDRSRRYSRSDGRQGLPYEVSFCGSHLCSFFSCPCVKHFLGAVWYVNHIISSKSNISLKYSRLHSRYRNSEVGLIVYTLRPNSSVMCFYYHLCWVIPSVEELAQPSNCGGRAEPRAFPREPHIATYIRAEYVG